MYNANDQDGYTAAFKWLGKNGINDHYLFNFDPDNKVNYKDSFTWYKNSKRDVNIHLNKNNIIYRKFDWNYDFNWKALEEILKQVAFDIIITRIKFFSLKKL